MWCERNPFTSGITTVWECECDDYIVLPTTFHKRKPNDCVVCRTILHELGVQQCHTRPKDWAPGWEEHYHTHHTHLIVFFAIFVIISYIKISYIEVFCGFENAYYMVKKHTTGSCGVSLHTTWHIPNAISCIWYTAIVA